MTTVKNNKIMNLHSFVSNLNIVAKGNRDVIYNSLLPISDYISGGLSKYKKQELLDLIEGINKYKNSLSKYIFGKKEIKLDEYQTKIVETKPDNNIRVISGAGSGKTTTILCRIKYLLDNFITPDRILILTFNKDAGENLREKVKELFGFNISLNIFTIDAFCCKIMHSFGEDIPKIYSLSEYSDFGLEIMKKYGKEISASYKYIFFDEFQDVNDVQFEILNIFNKNGCYLTVIGDDCQNIYQFRGTNNYYIINFDTLINNSVTFKLLYNYRSNKSIVDIANKSINNNKDRIHKDMVAKNENIVVPRLILSENDTNTIKNIIFNIRKHIDMGYDLHEIAILSRNTFQLKLIESALTENNIDYVSCITDKKSDSLKQKLEKNKIHLLTIHSSKGLEYRIVFIIGLSHKYFPSHINNNIKNIEEERRLFYVAITRAREKLYLMASLTEVPLSIFIKEIHEDILLKENNIKNYNKKDLFDFDDENVLIQKYGVTDLIELLKPNDYSYLRNNKLILDETPQITQMYQDKIEFSKKIIQGGFEADFGEFCDKYITRGIIKKQKEEFKDNNVKRFLDTIELENNEIIFYNLYKKMESLIKKYKNKKILNIPIHIMICHNMIKTHKNNNYIEDQNEFNEYINFIKTFMKNNKHISGWDMESNLNNIENKIVSQHKEIRRKYTYPTHIINQITTSYESTKTDKNNNEIINDIYWISLCSNFNGNRNRLAYRNINDIFNDKLNEEENKLQNRMNDYIKNIETSKCKIYVSHEFKNKNNDSCCISGEIDIICDDILIDIKCSQNEFKLEWLMQLLIYYSLLQFEQRIKIKKIAIMNIFNGQYYVLNITTGFKCDDIKSFLENKIITEQNNIRNDKMPIISDVLENNNNECFNNNIITLNYNTKIPKNEKKLKMILDTETTDFVGDIIQLAYIIIDENDNIIAKINDFIKNRIPSQKSMEIHKITPEKLQKYGIEFEKSIKTFLEYLEKCDEFIGHNIAFDIKTIKRNIRKFHINIVNEDSVIYDIFENIKIVCTCKMSNRTNLETLFERLCGNKFINAHDAMNDVMATFECYKKLK
jgi:DNA polymerase III epsilon subunit-like protein